jgi:hypothetical protein
VDDALVTAYVEADGQPALAAYVAGPRIGGRRSDELRHHLVALLPDYLVPRRLILLDHLPLAPDGEYDQAALPDPDGSERAAAMGAVPGGGAG